MTFLKFLKRIPAKGQTQSLKTLYPELKKAKAEGKKAVMVRDKLYIEGQVFYHAGNSA